VNWKWVLGPDGKNIPQLAGPNDWYFGKFRLEWQERAPYNGGNDDGIKPVYMRYSDILLMAAEIANDPACGSRDENFAKDCLLQVRQRAYKGNEGLATAYVNGLAGQTAIFNAIVDERALEFVGEMLRKNDLIRWNLLKTKMDESKEELQAWMDNAGTTFGPAVWYRFAADGSIETYGFNELATTEEAPKKKVKFCGECGAELSSKAKFCDACGAKQKPVETVCPNCGIKLKPTAKFCDECGTKIK
jgi:ribosomal protein L40E